MSKITKNEVANWIRNLVPYLEKPIYLAPKGCFKGQQDVKPGKIIEYDAALMPQAPQVINQTENLKALIELYRSVDDDNRN